MHKLQLSLIGNRDEEIVVYVDDKLVKFKKAKGGNLVSNLELEGSEHELRVETFNELDSKYWFIMAYFFFLISIFGILNPGYNKSELKYKYKGKFTLEEESSVINIKPYLYISEERTQKNNPDRLAFDYDGNVSLEENESRKFIIDKSPRKKLKILRIVKLFTVLVFIVIITVVVINS